MKKIYTLSKNFQIVPFENWEKMEQDIIDIEKSFDKFNKCENIKLYQISIILAALGAAFIIAIDPTGKYAVLNVLRDICFLILVAIEIFAIYYAHAVKKSFEFPFWWGEVKGLKYRIKLQKELNVGEIKKIVICSNHAQVEIEKLEGQVTIKSHFKVKTCQQNNMDRVILDVEKGMLFLPTCK